MTWDDGTVYQRVCGDNVEHVQDTLKEHICDLSSNITAATEEGQNRTFDQEELAEELHADALGGERGPPSSPEELFKQTFLPYRTLLRDLDGELEIHHAPPKHPVGQLARARAAWTA